MNRIEEVYETTHEGRIIGIIVLFSDDTSVTIDTDDNTIIDYFGMPEVGKDKIQAIEKELSITINQ